MGYVDQGREKLTSKSYQATCYSTGQGSVFPVTFGTILCLTGRERKVIDRHGKGRKERLVIGMVKEGKDESHR